MTVVLIGVLIIAIYSMEIYAKTQLLTAERRVQLQNELVFVLTDISNNIIRATGHDQNRGIVATNWVLGVRVDNNPAPTPDIGDDEWMCYRRIGNNIAWRVGDPFGCPAGGYQDLCTRDIILDGTAPDPEGFDFSMLDRGTGVDVTLRSRFDVTQTQSLSNPRLDMRIRVYSRSASGRM